MSIPLGTILLVLLVLMLVGAIPTWPHSRGWGYGPSGALGTPLLVVLILVLLGRIGVVPNLIDRGRYAR